MEKSRVQKFIVFSGLCSRKNAELLIEEGKVRVNGEIIKLGDKCFEKDLIEVNGEKITYNFDKLIYIILNKPFDYLTTNFDGLKRKIIYDLINENVENLFAVGRLDMDTTGLLILTNDRHFSQSLMHPSKKLTKEYEVYLDKDLTKKHKLELEEGLILDDYKLSPCTIKNIKNEKYSIIIEDGKKRQIRKIFELRGYTVKKLHRIKIGNLDLRTLDISDGNYKLVTKEFLEKNIF